jgi:hypothetical protein
MFGDFFTYFPIIFVLIILLLLFSKVWDKRHLLKKVYHNSKSQYEKNVALAKTNRDINYIPVLLNLIWAGYNLKVFFTDFSNEKGVFLNFWFTFFLLLLNIPFFIYKEKNVENNKTIAVIMFLCISLFCSPVLLIKQSKGIITLFVGWLLNYVILIFNNNEKTVAKLAGHTVFFVLFWLLILMLSVVIDINFSLPQKYNYGYLINTSYFLIYAYFNYFSSKYENL